MTRWRRRFASPDAAPVFEEVVPVPAPLPGAAIGPRVDQRDWFEIVLVSGRLLRVPATFDVAALSRLLAVVDGGRAC